MSEISYDGSVHDKERLIELQALPLDRKIQITQTRIIEWYNYWNGQVYVLFSGGKDSTVLLHIARKIFPEIRAVFCDTGLEYPEIRDFVKTVDNVTWIKPEMSFRKIIETYGYPLVSKEVSKKIEESRKCPDGSSARAFEPDSEYVRKYGKTYCLDKWVWLRDSEIPVSSQCCDVMKKLPSAKFERETGLHPIVGVTADESLLRATSWIQHGCNVFDGRHPKSRPLSVWKERDIIEYLYRYSVPYATVYGRISHIGDGFHTTGAQRTGCMFCPLGIHLEKSPNRFQLLKTRYPKIWEYCMKPWDDGGLGLREIFDRMGIPVD